MPCVGDGLATEANYPSTMSSERRLQMAHEPRKTLKYQSFLVRMWCEQNDAPWRASVTDVRTKETQSFINVEALFVYLSERTN